MQSTWFGDKALPGTFYGKSENGMCFVLILFKTKSNKLSFIKNIYWKYEAFMKQVHPELCRNGFSFTFVFFIQSFWIIGWMDTEDFAECLERFSSEITEWPLFILFDGHMTHVSLWWLKTN